MVYGLWAMDHGLLWLWTKGYGQIRALGFGLWSCTWGLWTVNYGLLALGYGLWAVGSRLWSLVSGLWALGCKL